MRVPRSVRAAAAVAAAEVAAAKRAAQVEVTRSKGEAQVEVQRLRDVVLDLARQLELIADRLGECDESYPDEAVEAARDAAPELFDLAIGARHEALEATPATPRDPVPPHGAEWRAKLG